MSFASRWLLLMTLVGCTSIGSSGIGSSSYGSSGSGHREVDWAKTVLLGTEVGDARDAVVRWREPVRYLVVSAPPRVRRAVDAAFRQLRAVLERSLPVHLEHVGSADPRIGSDGYISVFAKAPRDALVLAARYGAQPPQPQADGWFTIVWNRSFELTRALVFIDPGLTDKWLRHTALEEMFQCLGPSNDSATIRDSLLFESATMAGSHDHLARVDRQVLELLYQELEPGDRASDIESGMRRRWRFAPSVIGSND